MTHNLKRPKTLTFCELCHPDNNKNNKNYKTLTRPNAAGKNCTPPKRDFFVSKLVPFVLYIWAHISPKRSQTSTFFSSSVPHFNFLNPRVIYYHKHRHTQLRSYSPLMCAYSNYTLHYSAFHAHIHDTHYTSLIISVDSRL